MVERTRRSARGQAGGSDRAGGSKPSRRAFYRGEEGMRRSAEELERQKAKAEQRRQQGNAPFRFRVPVGETREAVILDDKPDFFQYEHNLKDSDGRWSIFTGCVKDWDNCPVCESAGRESYYAMYLSVLDLTPFETRNGDTVEFSRKLLVVKPAQHKKFMRFYEKEGTLRGAIFEFTRDGDKDSSIGNDIEFVEFMDEDELVEHVREWKDKDGKTQTEDCSEPYDYEQLFEEPDTEHLRAVVGGKPAPGSRAEERNEVGRDRRRARRGGDDSDQESSERDRGARRGRGASKDDMEDWEDPDSPPWGKGDAEGDERSGEATNGRRRRSREAANDSDTAPETGRRGARRGDSDDAQDTVGSRARRGRSGSGDAEDGRPASPRRVTPRRAR